LTSLQLISLPTSNSSLHLRLKDSELPKLASYENLGQLILNENNIQNLNSITAFKSLIHLQELDLSENPVSKIDTYREFVFST
jgi:Leucine-rich repeat (LRR) protein